jgi:hypothetical protein
MVQQISAGAESSIHGLKNETRKRKIHRADSVPSKKRRIGSVDFFFSLSKTTAFKDYLKHLLAVMALNDLPWQYLLKMEIFDAPVVDLFGNRMINIVQRKLGVFLYPERIAREKFENICYGGEFANLSNVASNMEEADRQEKSKTKNVIRILDRLSNASADGIVYAAEINTLPIQHKLANTAETAHFIDWEGKYGTIDVVVKKNYFEDHSVWATFEALTRFDPERKEVSQILDDLKESYNDDETGANLEIHMWFYLTLMNYNGSTPFFPYIYGSFLKVDNENYSMDLHPSHRLLMESERQFVTQQKIPHLPRLCCLTVMERLHGTLDLLLKNNYFTERSNLNTKKILPTFLQILFGLFCGFNQFGFVHNDLHLGNIMYKTTGDDYVFYKLGTGSNALYYKIPTHGYIFKVMDYGRSAFKCNKLKNIQSSTYKNWYSAGENKYWDVHNENADMLRFLSIFEYKCSRQMDVDIETMYDTSIIDHVKMRDVIRMITCKKPVDLVGGCKTLAKKYSDCFGPHCNDEFLVDPYTTENMKSFGIKNTYKTLIAILGSGYLIKKSDIVENEIIYDVSNSINTKCQ